jgi:glycosyltransferase involved in cell wall biosynthesis
LRWATKPIQREWVSLAARRFKPDILWLTHPALVDAIPARLIELPVIYDCMDDALGFKASRGRLELLARFERTLVTRASIILCSSVRLGELLIHRYGHAIGSKLSVVRNAISPSLLACTRPSSLSTATLDVGKRRSIAYIGTIAEWFDFDVLLAALEKNSNVEFHLVGPVAVRATPKHDRLIFHGIVRHSELWEFASQFDAYVMPFHVNPLIEAVDPVKLYEYLAFGKEVFTVRYAELERFSQFVHFYDTRSEFVHLIDRFVSGKLGCKNLPQTRLPFLAQNTWQSRSEQICQLLAGLSATT